MVNSVRQPTGIPERGRQQGELQIWKSVTAK